MPNAVINKILSLYVRLRYPAVPLKLTYFYRDTYNCELIQLRYYYQDYIEKKQYKEIIFDGEFGQELLFVIPFAYWHYKNGTLKKTSSCKFTKEFYYFSPDHREDFLKRTNEGNYNFEIPRILYSQDYKISKWLPPPFKLAYQNDIYKFIKPVLIIANRYNMEWDGPPISFYSIPQLDFIIQKLKDKFTIIYNRPHAQHIVGDGSEIYDLDEFNWLKAEHPDVLLMDDLYAKNEGQAKSFNHFQLMVYANATHFISVHGGTATLASYFGGTNLILSKQGPEHYFNCFHDLYPQLSGAKILVADNDAAVEQHILEAFV